MSKVAVLIHTVRGGRDPDDFWHVVTEDLANELDAHDPWRNLDGNDPRILGGYCADREEAAEIATRKGYIVLDEEIDAIGY